MNKPQYLAELERLLVVFMTTADRNKTLSRIGALFDQAGPAGAGVLETKLGSPTRQAIRLSRIYDAAEGYEDEFLDRLEQEIGATEAPAPEPKKAPQAESAPEPEDTSVVPPLIVDDLPGFEPPVIPDVFVADEPAPGPEPESEAKPEPEPTLEAESLPAEPAGEPVPLSEAAAETPDGPAPESAPAAEEVALSEQPEAEQVQPQTEDTGPAEADLAEEEPDQPGPAYTVLRSVPLAAGVPLFILSVLVLGVPLGLLCLALVPVLALPGVALLLGAWLTAVGGLWCISYIADAVMLFGLALVVLAAGLVVLWLGLWLLVSIVSLYCRAMTGIAHLTLGKKVSVRA